MNIQTLGSTEDTGGVRRWGTGGEEVGHGDIQEGRGGWGGGYRRGEEVEYGGTQGERKLGWGDIRGVRRLGYRGIQERR